VAGLNRRLIGLAGTADQALIAYDRLLLARDVGGYLGMYGDREMLSQWEMLSQ